MMTNRRDGAKWCLERVWPHSEIAQGAPGGDHYDPGAPYGAISSNLDDSWRYENLLISINSERRCEMVEGNSQGC